MLPEHGADPVFVLLEAKGGDAAAQIEGKGESERHAGDADAASPLAARSPSTGAPPTEAPSTEAPSTELAAAAAF